MRIARAIGILTTMLAMACGGAEAPAPEPVHEEPTTSGSESTHEDNGPQIEGLMGTISSMAVRRALDPRVPRFMRCFSRRYPDVEVLGGHFEMAFRIARDGSVLWVYPKASSIGDRETERCMLDVAASTRFSQPQGGEAEFSFPLELDPPEDVRPATAWPASRVSEAVAQQADAVRNECGVGYTVTAYIQPGGDVIAAGVSSDAQVDAERLDCVAEAVVDWSLPDPGSYPAKVSFEL